MMFVAFLNLIHVLSGPLGAPLVKPLAYLDPGSGSFILQIILASLLASLLFFKNFWRQLISKFRKSDPTETTDEADDEDEPNA